MRSRRHCRCLRSCHSRRSSGKRHRLPCPGRWRWHRCYGCRWHVGNATGAEHSAQSSNEGRQLELADQNAIDQANHQAGSQSNQQRNDDGESLAHERCGDHGGHGDNRTDGQVDVTGDQDNRLANTHQQVLCHGTQQVQNVVDLQDVGVNHAEHQQQDDPACETNQCGAQAADGSLFLVILQSAHFVSSSSYTAASSANLFSNWVARVRISAWVVSLAMTSPVIRPSHMTMIRSAMPITSGISEETNITATPCCFS